MVNSVRIVTIFDDHQVDVRLELLKRRRLKSCVPPGPVPVEGYPPAPERLSVKRSLFSQRPDTQLMCPGRLAGLGLDETG